MIVMDMLLFMWVIDVMLDWLFWVKYKVIDLVKFINEGDMGLVVYVGDVFIISLLIEDVIMLIVLFFSLSLEIMFILGSELILGLKVVVNLLESVGY